MRVMTQLMKSVETDWSDCPAAERIPGKVSGAWLLKDTRLPVDAVIGNFDAGESPRDIAALFDVPQDKVRAILIHAKRLRAPYPAR